jgi:hypothetical protein
LRNECRSVACNRNKKWQNKKNFFHDELSVKIKIILYCIAFFVIEKYILKRWF